MARWRDGAIVANSCQREHTLLNRGYSTLRAPSYPATRYEPSPVIDLASRAERERVSPSALKAFFNIIERWAVRDEDARQLLGGVTNGPYYKMKKAPQGRLLDADKLLRISYLI